MIDVLFSHLAFVTLLSPWMLAGLGLIVLPVLAHLLHRRIKRRVMFPSLMLLSQTVATHRSFEQVRRWLLLALRCLAILLIVLAFARPWWVSKSVGAATLEQATATVIVVDLSASLQQDDANGLKVSPRMREAVVEILRELEPGRDVANLVVTDDGKGLVAPVFPQLSGNLDALISEARTLTPGPLRADLPAALSTATRMLGEFAGPRRLAIVSDMQATNWTDMTPAAVSSAMQLLQTQGAAATTRVELINVMADRTVGENIALTNLRTVPAQPIAGQPCSITATLFNPNERRTSVTWTLIVEDEPALRFTQQLEPGERRVVSVPMVFENPGLRRMRLSIGDDALLLDNVIEAWTQVRQRQPVTVISDDDMQRPGTAGYFLARALSPLKQAGGRFEVTTGSSATLTDQAKGLGVVFLTDVTTLKPEAVTGLGEMMQRGGAVVYFLGDGSVPANVAALSNNIVTVGALRENDEQVNLQQGAWDSRWLNVFTGRSRAAIQRLPIERFWDLNVGERAEVILRYSDQTPAIVVVRAQDSQTPGPLVLVNIGLGRDWSDLATSGLIVPMAQHLAVTSEDLARGGVLASEGRVGGPLVMSVPRPLNAPQDATLKIFGPDEQTVTGSSIEVTPQGIEAIVSRTHELGVYTLRQDLTMLAARTVVLDSRESDLRVADVAGYEDLFQATAGRTAGQSGATVAGAEEEPTELWGWAVLLAALFLVVESGLLGWWRR